MSKVVHFEIPAHDPEKTMRFYKDVFGWNFSQFGEAPYWLAITGDEKTPGINGAIMKRNAPHQPVTNSISVTNLDEAIKKVEAAGGKVVVPKTVISGVGWSAYFQDIDNNIFGLWHENHDAK
jgi:uncharacterized protein